MGTQQPLGLPVEPDVYMMYMTSGGGQQPTGASSWVEAELEGENQELQRPQPVTAAAAALPALGAVRADISALASSRSEVVEAPTLLPRFASQNLKSGHEMEDIYVGLEALLAVPFALGLAARTADCTPRKPIHYRCKTSSRAGSLPSLGKHVYVAKNDLAACATWCRATFGTAFRGYATIDPQSNNANLCKCISASAGDALVAQCVAYYTAALRPSRSVFEIVHLGDSDCPEQSRSNELRLLRREVVREASLRPDAHAPLLDPARFNLKQCCAGFSIVVDQTRRVQLDDGTSCEYWDMLGGNFAQKINGGTSSLVCLHLICSLSFDVCHRAAY